MKLKSYFAADVETAFSRARQELGPEAMLVHSRKASAEARHRGEYEVVFAVEMGAEADSAAGKQQEAGRPETLRTGSSRVGEAGDMSAEVAEIRRQLERMAIAVSRSAVLASAKSLLSKDLAGAFASLISCELDPELAHDILNRIRAAGAPEEEKALRLMLAEEIGTRFRVDSDLGRGGEGSRIVALVGPPGAGKTMTLVKLAVLYGLKTRRPTQLISMDTFRIAATEQLRSYAAILGLGFQALETTRALEQALEEHRRKDLILIDTPGHALHDLDRAAESARFLASRPDIDIHLVLPASMRAADLARIVDQFEVFQPGKLIFTKLDETETYGPILNEAIRMDRPISFLSDGQAIPEDLAPATKNRVLGLLLKEEALAQAAAA